MNEMEKEMAEGKKSYMNIPIPNDIDLYIQKGMLKAKKKKLRRTQLFRISSFAAAVLIILFSSMRMSPAFAAFMSNIPGMENVVNLISHDRGLQLSLENDFIQPIGVSDKQEGITFTVDGIIVDEGRLNVFYTIQNDSKYPHVEIMGSRLLTETGQEMRYTVSSSQNTQPTTNVIQNRLDFNFLDHTKLPDSVLLSVKMAEVSTSPTTTDQISSEDRLLDSAWQVKIPIDHDKFANLQEEIETNKTLEVDGQKITFKKVTIYPTRIALDVEFDPNNSKKIFGFRGLTIENEKGEKLSTFGASLGENSQTIYFESNYFNKPKHLYISGNHINALSKDQLTLAISLKDQQIVSAPDDQVKLAGITREGDYFLLTLTTANLAPWDTQFYNIIGDSFTDASGKAYQTSDSKEVSDFTTLGSGHDQRRYVRINTDQDYQDPLTFDIIDYPAFISQEFKVQIK